ncbi:MAG TPA: RluA family pseudouridine synthase [Candidatus Saccharimonadales bacterium]|nr:RluA family pseudouridine synthase [Candidatus Saccharimonadales bacterium]
MRLDAYLAQYWPEYSRSQWQKYLKAGYVLVNGEIETSAKRQLGEDDEVKVELPSEPDFSEESLPVIYEDDQVIVINKPTGILTHAKGAVVEEFTVADFIKPRMTEPEDNNRPGIVHRLDRATSGVLIAGKDPDSKRYLQKQFSERKAKKTYLAIVKGQLKHQAAKIDLPIERNPKAPATFRVGPNGKSASTDYRVLSISGKYSLIELKPLTGRTHQLRVHLQYLNAPILGDALYDGGKSPIGRLCLHAWQLEITVPSRERKTFVAPPPEDFKQALVKLGLDDASIA